MRYGSRALALLKKYYEFKIPSIDEEQLPQEHIESIADENVGLLEETVGKFLNLSHMQLQNCLGSKGHIAADVNIQLSL
jgi:N-acetyltransferase 10